MAPKRSAVVDVLARKGYYDEMTNTFEEINEKRDIVEKELQELVEEREELVKAIAELQARLEQIGVSNKANCKALRKTERILRQLEQGGAVARAALRKLLLSRMTLEERVAKVREDFQLSCNWPASPVSRQRLKKEDLTMTRTEEDGSEVVLPMRSYCATGIEKPPVIVYFHGESYVAGTLDTHDWLCSALAQLSQAAVLSVEYRRPPEVRFPVPVDDAWAALQWAAAGSLGWPAPALAVAGDAAGGALAMACALRARAASERGEEVPDLRVQVLFYPWVDVRPNSDSMQSCQEDNDLHILMQEDLAFASEIYGPPRVKSSEEEEEEEEDDEPKVEEWMKVEEASPLLAGTLQNLPRTFLAYAADDLLAPDCRALVSRLRKEQGAEAVHELELPGPLGPGFAKDPTKAASYAALAAAGAFASGAFMGRS